MPDNDDRLSADLQDYYRQMARQPVPDVTGRVMMSTDSHAMWRRRWGAIGGGLLAAGAVAAIIVLALVNHGSPTGIAPAHSPTPLPTVVPSTTPTPAATSTPTPTTAPVVVGPPLHGFVPTDVTAVSADQWWVLGYNGPSCSSSACTRIAHTTDGGHTFTSIPVPTSTGAPFDRLRFADASNGWAVTQVGAVWATHDGGASWTRAAGAASVSDLEASGGVVYAIACTGSACRIESSPTTHDSWSTVPGSPTGVYLRNLLVNGSHIWAVNGAQSATSLTASANGGLTFTTENVCAGDLGISSVYAVDGSVMWATCATGTQAAIFHSTDSGRHFATVGSPGIANSSSIAGVSSSVVVVGSGVQLQRSVNGGRSFVTVEGGNASWQVVGFTTSSSGFVLQLAQSGSEVLWHSNDAGAHWNRVQFP